METHYTKHHAAYTANFNAAVDKVPAFAGKSPEEIFLVLEDVGDPALRAALRNNGGGFYNHNLYFSTLSPDGGGGPMDELAEAVNRDFGGFDALKEKLSAAAAGRFGSGWAWLSANAAGELKVTSSPNQDNPIMETAGAWTPILGIDVWEHAYYLKYRNLRADYVKAFFNAVDWKRVGENYLRVRG
jgi:Fe-Mn family superoxide dismutase